MKIKLKFVKPNPSCSDCKHLNREGKIEDRFLCKKLDRSLMDEARLGNLYEIVCDKHELLKEDIESKGIYRCSGCLNEVSGKMLKGKNVCLECGKDVFKKKR